MFNNLTYSNDIALFTLSSTATLNNYVQLACLPQSQSTTFPEASDTGVVAGWGALTYNGAFPNILNNVRITVNSNNTCYSYGYTSVDFGVDYDSQFCAGIFFLIKFLFFHNKNIYFVWIKRWW